MLGNLLTRSITWTAHNDFTGATAEFVIAGDATPLAPQWPTASYRGAMAIPGVARAVTLITGTIAGLPVRLFDGDKAVATQPLLLQQPNPPESRISTISSLILDYLFHGNAIARYTAYGPDGVPTALIPVPAEDVNVARRESDGAVVYEIGGKEYAASEILHVKNLHAPGELRGQGVLEAQVATLTLSQDLQAQAATASHGVPTGIITSTNPDLTPGEASAIKRKWLEAQRQRSIAVMSSAMAFSPVAWSPSDAQLIEARQFSLSEIAMIFGLDQSWLGVAQSSRTYSNAETIGLDLLRFTLRQIIERFEAALSEAFPGPAMTVKFIPDALLETDTLTRYQAHRTALDADFLTINEVRALENRPPVPGGDVLRSITRGGDNGIDLP